MKNTTLSGIIAILLLMSSCRTKSLVTEITKIDTLRVEKIITIDRPQLNRIVFSDVCDSLGNLRPILYASNNGVVKSTLKSENNKLIFEVNIDSIRNEISKEYESKNYTNTVTETKEVRYIPKFVYISFLLNILVIVYFYLKFKLS